MMLLGQVLEFVVVEVAAQTHGGQHHDRPVVHARRPRLRLESRLTSAATLRRIPSRVCGWL